MLQKLSLYYYTLKYLKIIQTQYQLWYRLRRKWRVVSKFKYLYEKIPKDFERVKMEPSIFNYSSYLGKNHFSFLNLDHKFESRIDWDFNKFGKLWTYNLNYFEFINQEKSQIFQSEYKETINDFIHRLPSLSNANEPFPTSLRIINWIKYITRNEIEDAKWNSSLYSQSLILKDNIEYHLLGNHLLENGFALTMAGIYFQDSIIYKEGRSILEQELKEQILEDGAHFELSPMYHSLMLYRLLDTINLVKSNVDLINKFSSNQESFLYFLKSKAESMVGWLKAISYDDGSFPHFNDSTDGIAPNVIQLFNYATYLGVLEKKIILTDSGFRRLKNKDFDIIYKTGKIGPDYIPGHAHADSLSFVCQINDMPFIVDTGISTYEKNLQRQKERSTVSHNTVTLKKENSSSVWGGFRVGNRAKSRIMNESKNNVSSQHDGYVDPVYRSVFLDSNTFIIEDRIENKEGDAHFHFGPNVNVKYVEGNLLCGQGVNIKFENYKNIILEQYQLANGFNKTILSTKAIVTFQNTLKTIISYT